VRITPRVGKENGRRAGPSKSGQEGRRGAGRQQTPAGRTVTANDVYAPERRALRRYVQMKDVRREGGDGHLRHGDGEKGVQEDRTVVV